MSAADPETRIRETEADYQARLAALALERDEMKARAERAEHDRDQFKKLYLLVALELERLKRQLFGQKAETVDPAQVQLAFAPVVAALQRAEAGGKDATEQVESELAKLRERAQAEVARRKAEKKKPKPHGRRDVSLENLPVEIITLEPPERLAPGGDALVWIGDEVSEQIDRRPATLVRVRLVRRKYKVREAAASADEAQPARPPDMANATTSAAGKDDTNIEATPVAPDASAEQAQSESAAAASTEAAPATAVREAAPENLAGDPAATAAPPPAPTEGNGQPMSGATQPPAASQAIKLLKPGTILIAPLPDRPIPRGIAGPGLLAHVLVSKFADHSVPRRHRRELSWPPEVSSCTADEGRPLGAGQHGQASNHLELLWPNGWGGERRGKGVTRSRQAGTRKTNASEPLMMGRKESRRRRNRAGWLARDGAQEARAFCLGGVRPEGGVSLVRAAV